jgi:hypothetical protein
MFCIPLLAFNLGNPARTFCTFRYQLLYSHIDFVDALSYISKRVFVGHTGQPFCSGLIY